MVTSRPLLVSTPGLVAGPVRGGITTRRGFPPATMAGVEDPARRESRRILARLIGLDESRMAWLKQVHGTTALDVSTGGLAGEADALVTGEPSLALLVAVADCGPVLLADRRAGVIGAVHAGWRGAAAGICEAAIAGMCARGADARRITAWIGPCIGPDRFEVGPEVAAQFPAECVVSAPDSDRKPHVDLAGAIRLRLLDAGLDRAHIRASGQCTVDLADRYWSYRRDGGICGRQFAWIVRDG